LASIKNQRHDQMRQPREMKEVKYRGDFKFSYQNS